MLVLAHRGCPSPRRPENSVAAMTAALAGPADGVEVDVRLSADGVLVCSHDRDLIRLSGQPLCVSCSTSAELRRVALAGGHRMATLDEVLAAVGGFRGARVVVEAKPVPSADAALRTAQSLCRALDRAGSGIDVTVSSFDPTLLGVIRSTLHRRGATAAVRSALLGRPADCAETLLRRTVDAGHDELHPHLSSLVRAAHTVGVAHSLGASVTCWTVNRRSHVRRLAHLGVDAVISDRPAAARATLAGTRTLAQRSFAGL
ncbi:MAG: glycerophosphodiester phosphodiesterase [Actinomycetota bacterium]|nr:glycerophosphodiester phosphodiesterase [Actinomycetota bacterium]